VFTTPHCSLSLFQGRGRANRKSSVLGLADGEHVSNEDEWEKVLSHCRRTIPKALFLPEHPGEAVGVVPTAELSICDFRFSILVRGWLRARRETSSPQPEGERGHRAGMYQFVPHPNPLPEGEGTARRLQRQLQAGIQVGWGKVAYMKANAMNVIATARTRMMLSVAMAEREPMRKRLQNGRERNVTQNNEAVKKTTALTTA